jgi:hypothetical protein
VHLHILKSSVLSSALACLFAGTSAYAQTIFGGYDCGQWTHRPKNHPMESWVAGYISGLNSMHALSGLKPNDPLDELNSLDQAIVWMDNFCKANPLRKVDGAALALFGELKTRRSSRPVSP